MTSIKEARQAAGLTQQGVTNTLGIPKRTLQDWESGKRTPPGWAEALVVEKLKRIAQESQAARSTATEK
ncbi:helix-turn-helix domain-containing protein [uncultured Acidaminococcus sp.]|uniref:helix-turn-helix domain-containing protein n=1 Tax=uncultured Acidaminococcus sp. TaxID=352152 RepID=UPI0033905191